MFNNIILMELLLFMEKMERLLFAFLQLDLILLIIGMEDGDQFGLIMMEN